MHFTDHKGCLRSVALALTELVHHIVSLSFKLSRSGGYFLTGRGSRWSQLEFLSRGLKWYSQRFNLVLIIISIRRAWLAAGHWLEEVLTGYMDRTSQALRGVHIFFQFLAENRIGSEISSAFFDSVVAYFFLNIALLLFRRTAHSYSKVKSSILFSLHLSVPTVIRYIVRALSPRSRRQNGIRPICKSLRL